MALSDTRISLALVALQQHGFYYEEDPQVGEKASQPFEDIDTEAGLQFYKDNFLDDPRISAILRTIYKPCFLTVYRTFFPEPKRMFQFRAGGPEADHFYVALLWPPGSALIYYANSDKHNLPAVQSDNGLWSVPEAAAKKAGCAEGTPVNLEQGGL